MYQLFQFLCFTWNSSHARPCLHVFNTCEIFMKYDLKLFVCFNSFQDFFSLWHTFTQSVQNKLWIRFSHAKYSGPKIAHHSNFSAIENQGLKIVTGQSNPFSRPVASGGEVGSGGACTPPLLADQLTLSQPGGVHYPHPILHTPLPDFQTFLRPCGHY